MHAQPTLSKYQLFHVLFSCSANCFVSCSLQCQLFHVLLSALKGQLPADQPCRQPQAHVRLCSGRCTLLQACSSHLHQQGLAVESSACIAVELTACIGARPRDSGGSGVKQLVGSRQSWSVHCLARAVMCCVGRHKKHTVLHLYQKALAQQ